MSQNTSNQSRKLKAHSNETGSWQQLQDKLDEVIIAYNTLRPHDSCDGLTPEQAHLKQGILNKKWKNYKKEKWIRKNKEIE